MVNKGDLYKNDEGFIIIIFYQSKNDEELVNHILIHCDESTMNFEFIDQCPP